MGGITLMDIVDKMTAVLSTDTALQAWCATHYKAPIIQVGLDERDRPQAEDMPVILIRPNAQGLGQTRPGQAHTVLIDWGIHDDTVTVTGLVKEYAGVRRVDELGNLIWDALCSGISPSVSMDQAEYTLETVENFPLLLGGMDITVNVPRVLGAQITL